jgi:hypothetical protein
MWQGIAVRPGGNRVRSYLDIVAPDETSWTEIRQRFVTFVSGHQLQAMPWSGASRSCLFRANMDQALAQPWHHEIAELYRAAQAARIGGSPLSGSCGLEGPGPGIVHCESSDLREDLSTLGKIERGRAAGA